MSIDNENIVLTAEVGSNTANNQSPNPNPNPNPEFRLADVPVTDQNVALNLMVSFLSLAQQRGAYKLEESAKIWECVKMFQITAPTSSPP